MSQPGCAEAAVAQWPLRIQTLQAETVGCKAVSIVFADQMLPLLLQEEKKNTKLSSPPNFNNLFRFMFTFCLLCSEICHWVSMLYHIYRENTFCSKSLIVCFIVYHGLNNVHIQLQIKGNMKLTNLYQFNLSNCIGIAYEMGCLQLKPFCNKHYV